MAIVTGTMGRSALGMRQRGRAVTEPSIVRTLLIAAGITTALGAGGTAYYGTGDDQPTVEPQLFIQRLPQPAPERQRRYVVVNDQPVTGLFIDLCQLRPEIPGCQKQ